MAEGSKPDPSPETETLLNDLDAGSVAAFELLAQDLRTEVARIVRTRSRPGIKKVLDTDDLVQNVWATVLSRLDHLPRFENRGQAIRYFARVARRQVTKQRRRYYAEMRDVRRDVSLDGRDVVEKRATPSREFMCADRSNLSDVESKVLELRLTGHSRTEIADLLNTNETRIRRILGHIAAKQIADGSQ